jgi:hypothetical protein
MIQMIEVALFILGFIHFRRNITYLFKEITLVKVITFITLVNKINMGYINHTMTNRFTSHNTLANNLNIMVYMAIRIIN